MKNIFLFLFCLISFSAVAQVYPVGVRTITWTDPARSNRSIAVEFHYPAVSAGSNTAVANDSFPFVVFGHGFQITAGSYPAYYDTLAKLGYIVALPTTEGSLSPSHADFAKDFIFVYNKLISESNTNNASPFYQKVVSKGAIGGHSMGGGATVLSCQYSNPATCYFTFAAANTNPSSISAASYMTKPYLDFAGTRDCVAPPAANQLAIYDSSTSPCKYYINIKDATHCQFSATNATLCFLGEGVSFCSSTPLSITQQQTQVFNYLLPYLKYYLKGDCAAWTQFENIYAADIVNTTLSSCNSVVPSNSSITGNNYFCNGDSTTLTASPAGFNYLWSDNSTNDSLNISSAGIYSLVVGNDVCSLPTVSVSVTENFPPAIGTIIGADTICESTATTHHYLSSVANADTIIWWTTHPLAIISGSGTDTIIIFNNGFGGTIWAYASNQCGQSPVVNANLFMNDTPQVTIAVQGNQLVSQTTGSSYRWYIDGTEINGDTGSAITPLQTGNYSVEVMDNNGCSGSSQVLHFIFTGMRETETDIFSVYPNPNSTGKLQFSITEAWLGAEMEISDIEGRIVMRSEIDKLEFETETSNLRNGVYVITIEKKGQKLRKKIVIQ